MRSLITIITFSHPYLSLRKHTVDILSEYCTIHCDHIFSKDW